MSFFSRIFSGGNERELNKIQPVVEEVNRIEKDIESLTDTELKGKTQEFKDRIKNGQRLDDILPEAFAVVREASKREIGQRHFDVQILGGVVLHQGKIAEMKTGEGKTLVATMPLYLNALEGKGAHLVTVNDYLARFQGEWMGRIYHRLGVSTGIVQNQGVSYIFDPLWSDEDFDEDWKKNLRPCTRKEAYAADITYGTNNEFGFDYMRDNMAQSSDQLSQRGLHYCIVDEVDSILIDEARTPLIISSPAEESANLYARFATLVTQLKPDEHYEVDEKIRAVSLSDQGVALVEKILGVENIYRPETIDLVHHLEEALKADVLFKKDKDYIVKDGEVIIVDEFTGRLMPGRRYSEGLHQAIEAKEGVEIKKESDTLATISFQNLFRLYDKLSGMTGTAATEAEEFGKIYKLDVIEIPTYRPMVRRDYQDQIYKTEDAKYKAIVDKIEELYQRGQPVLVGTISIEKSEKLAKLLARKGIKHEVLNAKQHEKEAKIIIQAGRLGRVTVATNMAGRGVDIILGGNPPDPEEARKVREAGGLVVLGTERHESRRIDNQLRGRSGRQGDPGGSQFYISLDDELMRIFGGERLRSIMNRLGLPDDQPIEHGLITKSIESAQRKVESHNFDIRKHLVEYDDVMNKQREIIYSRRRRILTLDTYKDNFLHEQILSGLSDQEKKEYEEKTRRVEQLVVHEIEKKVFLSVIDQLWVEHLNTMDQLRDSIGLRGYGQVDPLIAYKQESFRLFDGLMHAIDENSIEVLLKVDFAQVEGQRPRQKVNPLEYHGGAEPSSGKTLKKVEQETETSLVEKQEDLPQKQGDYGVTTTVRGVSGKMEQAAQRQEKVMGNKVGRNDPCPCGSGKKYKKCCGK